MVSEDILLAQKNTDFQIYVRGHFNLLLVQRITGFV